MIVGMGFVPAVDQNAILAAADYAQRQAAAPALPEPPHVAMESAMMWLGVALAAVLVGGFFLKK